MRLRSWRPPTIGVPPPLTPLQPTAVLSTATLSSFPWSHSRCAPRHLQSDAVVSFGLLLRNKRFLCSTATENNMDHADACRTVAWFKQRFDGIVSR